MRFTLTSLTLGVVDIGGPSTLALPSVTHNCYSRGYELSRSRLGSGAGRLGGLTGRREGPRRMARLEGLTPGARVAGVVASQAVTVVQLQ